MLILTAFSQRELVEQARDAGALAYLVKPFQKSDLIPAIEVAHRPVPRAAGAAPARSTRLGEQLEARKVDRPGQGHADGRARHDRERRVHASSSSTAMSERTHACGDVAERVIDGSTSRP